MALDEFFSWYALEPRPGFSKATVSAWRVTLEERGLGSSSIIVRMSAIRKLAVEATDPIENRRLPRQLHAAARLVATAHQSLTNSRAKMAQIKATRQSMKSNTRGATG